MEKICRKTGSFATLYSAIFYAPSFHKSLKFFRTSIASLDPETVQLPALHTIHHVYRSVVHQRSWASPWCCTWMFCTWLWNLLIGTIVDFSLPTLHLLHYSSNTGGTHHTGGLPGWRNGAYRTLLWPASGKIWFNRKHVVSKAFFFLIWMFFGGSGFWKPKTW